jgi:hypothetical protein
MRIKARLTCRIAALCAVMLIVAASCAFGAPFVPTDPIMPLSQVKPGMKGEARTVMTGTGVTSFKVTLLGVLPRKTSPKALILIRVDDPAVLASGGIAEGMSGSPVYVGGRLVGAIGYGWAFSEKGLGLVTPIEEMVKVHDWPDKIPPAGVAPKTPQKPPAAEPAADVPQDLPACGAASDDAPDEAETEGGADEPDGADVLSADIVPMSMPILTDGISPRAAEAIARKFNFKLVPLGASSDASNRVDLKSRPKPGSAIGVSLAWGDIQMGGIGTLTAVSRDGRFIGFGHPMSGQGAVAFPLTEASVLRVIPSLESSFKLGFQGPVIGLVTQDRPEAIGGRFGRLAPADSYAVRINDVDAKKVVKKTFQTVSDPFTGPSLGLMGIVGIIDDEWARNGEGTALIKYRFRGGNLPRGWERSNMFFSDTDLIGVLLKEFGDLASIFALNQFQEIRPFGAEVEVEITRDPRVVYIEKITVRDKKEFYAPGDEIKLDVTFRPWRKAPSVRSLTLKVPEKAVGFCEIVVRGGGIEAPQQESLLSGLRAITDLGTLLGELSAQESNNQVIVEINGPEIPDFLKGAGKGRAKEIPSPEDFLDDRLASEIKADRVKKGQLRVIDTNYYVEGLLRKYIKIKPTDDASGAEDYMPEDALGGASGQADEDAAGASRGYD